MFTPGEHAAGPAMPAIPIRGGLVLVTLAARILLFGVFPDSLMFLIQAASIVPR